jgi:hypothetical protein
MYDAKVQRAARGRLVGSGVRRRFDGPLSLFTQYGLQPIDGDEAPFGEVVHLSAELTEQK